MKVLQCLAAKQVASSMLVHDIKVAGQLSS